MLSAVLFLSLLFVAMPVLDSKYPPDNADTSSTFCKYDSDGSGIETFASSFYTAMVVEHGYDVVASTNASGPDAAKSEYNVVLEILQGEGLCDAAWVAFTASRPFASFKSVPLAVYLEKTAHTVAEFLVDNGLLKCSTAIPLSFDFFKLVRKAFNSSDEDGLGPYQHAVVQGLVDFIHEHGLELDDAANDLAYKFFKEFSSGKNCTKSGN